MAKENETIIANEDLIQAAKNGHLRIPSREDGLTFTERLRMAVNEISSDLLPTGDNGLCFETPTSEEIERYGLNPWFHFVPVAIQERVVREPYGMPCVVVDRHFACDKGFQTAHERIQWKNKTEEASKTKCLILEDCEEWAEYVANDLKKDLTLWTMAHTLILSER